MPKKPRTNNKHKQFKKLDLNNKRITKNTYPNINIRSIIIKINTKSTIYVPDQFFIISIIITKKTNSLTLVFHSFVDRGRDRDSSHRKGRVVKMGLMKSKGIDNFLKYKRVEFCS